MRHWLILPLLLILFSFNSWAQSIPGLFAVGVPGVGVSLEDAPSPYASRDPAYRARYLIRAEEIAEFHEVGAAIRSIGFLVEQRVGYPLRNFTIRLKPTTDNVLTRVPDENGLITVFGPTTYIEHDGINIHDFHEPYCWNGLDNLIIDICVQNAADDHSNSITGVAADVLLEPLAYHDWNDQGDPMCSVGDTTQQETYFTRPKIFLGLHPLTDVDLRSVSATQPEAIVNLNDVLNLDLTIQNYGCPTAGNITFGYQWNREPIHKETTTISLSAGATFSYNFVRPQPANVEGFNVLKIWVEHPADNYPFNDTITKLLTVLDGNEQGLNYLGNEFWIGFMKNYNNDPSLKQKVHLTSRNDANVTISIPGAGWEEQRTLTANTTLAVEIPTEINGIVTANETSDFIGNAGIHITSSDFISVYADSRMDLTSDAFLAIPTRSVQKEYVVTAPMGIVNPGGEVNGVPLENAPAEFLIVAVEDNTAIEIIAPVPTSTHDANERWTINLNEGQTYLVTAAIIPTVDDAATLTTFDLTGTSVCADKPIALFGGSQCALVPNDPTLLQCQSCDHLIEQLTPIVTWGNSFILTDFELKPGQDYARLVAGSTDVSIAINGNPTYTLANKGDFVDIAFDNTVVVEANDAIQVDQMCSGGACMPRSATDPFMMNIIATEQWGNYYRFTTPDYASYRDHFVNIVKKHASTRVGLDGDNIPLAEFTQIGTTDYFVSKKRISSGSHLVTGDSNIVCYVYGFGHDESYGYPAAGAKLELNNIKPPRFILSTAGLSCAGDGDGSVSATILEGCPPFEFEWSNGATTDNIDNLQPGRYILTVTNVYGAQYIDSVDLEEPAPLAIILNKEDNPCSGDKIGTIEALVTGGIPPYTYQWSHNIDLTSNVVDTLVAGVYRVTARDNNNCSINEEAEIITPTALQHTKVISNPLCNGDLTGEIFVTALEGTPPYTILWENNSTDFNRADLGEGSYAATISDNNNCTLAIDTVIEAPSLVVIEISKTDNSCNGSSQGSIQQTVAGGIEPFTFIWSDGNTEQNRTDLAAGEYVVTTSDANNCSLINTVSILEPTALVFSVDQQNISCFEESDGSISISPSGGTPPYEISWDSNISGFTPSSLTAGTYSFNLQDDNNCMVEGSVTLTAPSQLNESHTIVNPSCFGNNDGSIEAGITGGTSPYRITWSNATDQFKNDSLIAGDYTATILDNNDCAILVQASLTEPQDLESALVAIDNACSMDQNGSIDVTISGGTMPYFFAWNDGNFNKDRINLPDGKYVVQVTDNQGCQLTDSNTIASPEPLIAEVISKNVNCKEDSDGSITVEPTGGTVPYTIEWNRAISGFEPNNLPPDMYSFVLTDANGCTFGEAVDIIEPTALTFSETATHPSCAGNSDGEIAISAADGSPPYRMTWDSGEITFERKNLSAGTYTGVLNDAHNCKTTIAVNLQEPLPLAVALTKTNVTCTGFNNGIISADASGGTPPYAYKWSNNAVTDTITQLEENEYHVTIIDDLDCSVSASSQIESPPQLAVSYTTKDVACNGQLTGFIEVTPNGGTPPYSIEWQQSIAGFKPNNLASGLYHFTVQDANDCSVFDSVLIHEPPLLVIDSLNANAPDCINNLGDGAIYCQGGTAPYRWVIGNQDFYTTSTGFLSLDLSPGIHSVDLQDDNGCIVRSELIIPEIEFPAVEFTSKQPSCVGADNGSIELTITKGSPAYEIILDGEFHEPKITELSAGIHSIEVSDQKSCTSVIEVTLSDPVPIITTGEVQNSICGEPNGSITTTTTGGTLPYRFNWSNGSTNPNPTGLAQARYVLMVTDSLNCSALDTFHVGNNVNAELITKVIKNVSCHDGIDGQAEIEVISGDGPFTYTWTNTVTSSTNNQLSAGNHYATVVDGLGCRAILTVNLTEPTPTNIDSTNLSNTSCYGFTDGAITVFASGGTPPYNYQWSANSTTSNRVDKLAAGTYPLTINDANGCSLDTSFIVIDADSISAQFETISPLCAGDSTAQITASISGGTAPYLLQWSSKLSDTGLTATNLLKGTYRLTITDQQNCISVFDENIEEPDSIDLLIQSDTILCNGGDGTINAIASGGVLPYLYALDTIGNGQTEPEFSNLLAGRYLLTVEDANGCSQTASHDLLENGLLTAIDSIIHPSCYQYLDGQISVEPSGGVAPYSIIWNDNAPSLNRMDLAAGRWTYTLSDRNNCSITGAQTLIEPSELLIAASLTNSLCHGGQSGSINLAISGGTTQKAPYDINWSTGDSTMVINELSAGRYQVTVVDNNLCSTTDSFTIEAPDAFDMLDTLVTNLTCYGDENGAISFQIEGGTLPYFIIWENGMVGPEISGLSAGDYPVRITDGQGCLFLDTFSIQEPPEISTATIVTSSCKDSTNGAIAMSLMGGMAPLRITWQNFPSSTTLSNLPSGAYAYTVTDTNGCIYSDIVLVQELANERIEIAPGFGYYPSFEQAQISVSFDTALFRNWSWQPSNLVTEPNSLTTTALNKSDTTFTFNAIDTNGCRYSKTILVDILEEAEILLPNAFSPDGDGINDEFLIEIPVEWSMKNLLIYDRWGTKVFDHTSSWDGRILGSNLAPVGVYAYIVTIENQETGLLRQIKGNITLIR